MRRLRLDRPLSLGELGVALAGLAAIALLSLGPRIQYGGFSMDDWSNGALALEPSGSRGFGEAVSEFASFTLYRPVLVIYIPLKYFAFGMDAHVHLAFSALLAVLAATMFYGVLRMLGMPWIHAALIGALAIVFPWSDSTRLWVTADLVTLSLVFLFAGLLVALQGLERPGWRWHGCAVSLYLLSLLTYEVTLPLVACLGVLYCIRAGWRAARWRWLADLTVTVAAAIWVWANNSKPKSGISEDFSHLREIIEQGGVVLGHAGFPFGSPDTTLVLAAVAVVFLLGAYVRFRSPQRFDRGADWGLREWLALTLGGIALAALGWIIFVPAEPYYTPSVIGEVNRINGLAGFGLILVVYGTLGTLGALLSGGSARRVLLASVVTALLGIGLLASYTHVLRRHIQEWNLAYAAASEALRKTQRQFPRLPPDSTVLTAGYPAYQAPGVPILATNWDYDNMVKMAYGDGSLAAYPLVEDIDLRLLCRSREMVVKREDETLRIAPYGTLRLLDLATGKTAAPRNPHACRQAVADYVPGPTFLSETY